MTEPAPDLAALQTLAAWLSPSFPVGAYAWSHGLERAVEAGEAEGREGVEAWIADLIAHGAGRSDAVLLAHAHRDPADEAVADLARALQPSAERAAEAAGQGAAFARVAGAAWEAPGPSAPYPVALGRAAAARALPLEATATLFLQAFAANMVSAAIRLGRIGETDGQRILAALAPLCRETALDAVAAPLEEVGGACLRADLASMLHETQATRLFRS